ncbi:MAG: pyridoxal-phosphate dependent enzyme [Candidatus Eremiobacteraeota bacterium]|nr:pyridoxal-phosphate dependent enzyme [Candidatus Eremiobacteraeota bacterium]
MNIIKNPAAFPQQFKNPANSEIHRRTIAVEIQDYADGNVDIFVAGNGTGGTIVAVGEFLKKKNPKTRCIAVGPESSPVLSGGKHGHHKIQGIVAGFAPDVVNTDIINEIIIVKDEDAGNASRRLAKEEGLLCGISTGAATWADIRLASRDESRNKLIVVLFPDSAERYLSTWLINES